MSFLNIILEINGKLCNWGTERTWGTDKTNQLSVHCSLKDYKNICGAIRQNESEVANFNLEI